MNSELRNHIQKFLKQDLRIDGRKIDQYRDIEIEYGISKSAEGSARVKIGETQVIAGVKMEIGKPYSDRPDEGTIMVGAELLPLSSPDFNLGPPDIQSIELARVVDRGIRESKAIDFKSLCITPKEKIWILTIDICPLNDDGNLFDAAALAAIAAVKDARYPVVDGEHIDYKHKTDKKVELSKLPVNVTILKIGNSFIVDPTLEEEKVYDARLSVATTDDDIICALQKGGEEALTLDEVDAMLAIGIEKGRELRNMLR
jgi:exosome complex component RRP42